MDVLFFWNVDLSLHNIVVRPQRGGGGKNIAQGN